MASNRKVRAAQRLIDKLNKDLLNFGICVVDEKGKRIDPSTLKYEEGNLIIPENYRTLIAEKK